MPVFREISLSADALAIASHLMRMGGRIALLHSSGDTSGEYGRFSYVAALPDLRSGCIDPWEDDSGEAWSGRTAEHHAFIARAPRWIGVLPYEATRSSLERKGWVPQVDTRPKALLSSIEWHRFRACVGIDHAENKVFIVAMGDADADELIHRLNLFDASISSNGFKNQLIDVDVVEEEAPEAHIERVKAAKELILAGDLYQVNLARRLCVRVKSGDVLAVYKKMAEAAPTPFGAFLMLDSNICVLSTSPELFLDARTQALDLSFSELVTAPIKGTRPRGTDEAADRALIEELDADPKERAELTMIVDVERNDLGRIAETGSVVLLKNPHVVTHPTVHHRLAVLGARAKAGISRRDVLSAMLPSGSVTGAPKVRAMEVIASLEPKRRGLYTGALGFASYDGRMLLSMAIRTLVLEDNEGEYWTGGGIVADSDPVRELEETRWKALQLSRLMHSFAKN